MPGATALPVLLAISFCHLLNDMMQSLLPAMYPMLKSLVRAGLHPDRPDHPHLPAHRLAAAAADRALHRPPAQAVLADDRHGVHAGRACCASRWPGAIPACSCRPALVGLGSAVFHPESSRVARMASGGRHGLAQSLFQVGGNTGSAIGPLRRRVHRAAARPVERRVVLAGGAARDRGALARGPLVSASPRPGRGDPRRRRPAVIRRSRPARCGSRSAC